MVSIRQIVLHLLKHSLLGCQFFSVLPPQRRVLWLHHHARSATAPLCSSRARGHW